MDRFGPVLGPENFKTPGLDKDLDNFENLDQFGPIGPVVTIGLTFKILEWVNRNGVDLSKF